MSASLFPDFVQHDRGHNGLRHAELIRDGLLRTARIQRSDLPRRVHREFAPVGELPMSCASDRNEMLRVKAAAVSAGVVNLMPLGYCTPMAFVRPAVQDDCFAVDAGTPVAINETAVPLPAFSFRVDGVQLGVRGVAFTGAGCVSSEESRFSRGTTLTNPKSTTALTERSASIAVHVRVPSDVPRPERSNAAGHLVFPEQLYQSGGC